MTEDLVEELRDQALMPGVAARTFDPSQLLEWRAANEIVRLRAKLVEAQSGLALIAANLRDHDDLTREQMVFRLSLAYALAKAYAVTPSVTQDDADQGELSQ